MYLGQALLYIVNDPFIIKCEDTSILGITRGKEEIINNRFDPRLKGDILNTEIFRFSPRDNKVIFHV